MINSTIQNLNWVDYAIIGIVFFSALISFFRGFVREAISLIAWSLGFILALKYASILQIYLQSWISLESMRYFIAFVGIFLLVVIVGILINLLVHFIVSKSGLSFVDRFAGIIFGASRGVAIVAVMLLMLMNMGSITDSFALSQSTLASQFKPTVLWLNGFVPQKMHAVTQWVEEDLRARSRSDVA